MFKIQFGWMAHRANTRGIGIRVADSGEQTLPLSSYPNMCTIYVLWHKRTIFMTFIFHSGGRFLSVFLFSRLRVTRPQ